jgi:hypothetical protein
MHDQENEKAREGQQFETKSGQGVYYYLRLVAFFGIRIRS